MDKITKALQIRRLLEINAQAQAETLSASELMEIATIFPSWKAGKAYAKGDVFVWGVDPLGDPQLWKVTKAGTSQAQYTPDADQTMYTKVGIAKTGYPIWTQPSGAHDAYTRGDIVSYNDQLYICVVDLTAYAPGVYGWEAYTP